MSRRLNHFVDFRSSSLAWRLVIQQSTVRAHLFSKSFMWYAQVELHGASVTKEGSVSANVVVTHWDRDKIGGI